MPFCVDSFHHDYRFAFWSSCQFEHHGSIEGTQESGENVGGRRCHVCHVLLSRALFEYSQVGCVAFACSKPFTSNRLDRQKNKYISCNFSRFFFLFHRYTIDIDQSEVIAVLSLLSHWLCYANSAINPVIYNFMSGKSTITHYHTYFMKNSKSVSGQLSVVGNAFK